MEYYGMFKDTNGTFFMVFTKNNKFFDANYQEISKEELKKLQKLD